MRETFGVAGDSWKGFDFDWATAGAREDAADDGPRAASEGPEAPPLPRLGAGKPWISFVPDVPAEKVPEYFSDFSQTFGHNLCPWPGTSRRSSPTARSASAATSPTTSSATCGSSAFREIWTGEKASAFREKLAKEPLPICARCCGNYVYGKWERPQPRPLRLSPEPVEVEPLRRVRAHDALQVRGDARHDAHGVLFGRERRIGVERARPRR